MYRYVKVPNPNENRYTSTLISPVSEIETKYHADGSAVWRKYVVEPAELPPHYDVLYTTTTEDVYFPTEIRQKTIYVLKEPATIQPLLENLLISTMKEVIAPYVGSDEQKDIYKTKYTQASELFEKITSSTTYDEADYPLIASSVGILADTLIETVKIIYDKGRDAEKVAIQGEIVRISTQDKLRKAETSEEKLDIFNEYMKFAFIQTIFESVDGDITDVQQVS